MAAPSDQDARQLAGTRTLLIGEDSAHARALIGAIEAARGARIERAADVEDAVALTGRGRPDALVALDGAGAGVRARVDPLGVGAGPPVIDVTAEDPVGLVIARIAAAVERATLRARVRDLERVLATGAVAAHRATAEAEEDALRRLARAAEYRDDNTWEHTQRVAEMAARLGRGLGLDDGQAETLRRAAPLHDLGKIAIPDQILLKPDRLTAEEYEVVKTHAAVGAAILEQGDSTLLRSAERIARTHHERWDGGGYPAGLAGEAIPLEGRLVAVADVFDVLVHERPYKSRWTHEDAAAELRRNAGTQFDPRVVEAFDDLGLDAVRTLGPGD